MAVADVAGRGLAAAHRFAAGGEQPMYGDDPQVARRAAVAKIASTSEQAGQFRQERRAAERRTALDFFT